jgi:hypothetical protein
MISPLSKPPSRTLTMTSTMTMTSYLDHDLDQDHDQDQLMHGMKPRRARGCGDWLAKSAAHGYSKTADPSSGANTLTVTADSAGSLPQGGSRSMHLELTRYMSSAEVRRW